MATARNVLFIMYDQLRWDYLSCSGHPHLQTPNFDRVAKQGVYFTRCYVQSPVCGSSRMSTYTGRYVSSHGAFYNGVPLKVGESTMGDYLRDAGMDCVLVGKTHMRADTKGMQRLGIAPDGIIGARVSECGFDMGLRDDGLNSNGPDGSYGELDTAYNRYLNSRGYDSANPWHDHANSGVDDELNIKSGFEMINAVLPANISEQDSETTWLTGEMIKWLERRYDAADKTATNTATDNAPWCVHLSYIKPHWPYIVPAPYHDMYSSDQVLPAVQGEHEHENPHPVLQAFQRGQVATTSSQQAVRESCIPAYMGLIKQCDDQLGRLLDYLENTGRLDDTVVVLTSDHGDYLGDHYLGEKGLWHDCSVKVPLIVMDPDSRADATRGTSCDALVEAIDMLPTVIDIHAGPSAVANQNHILEGHSLLPYIRGLEDASQSSETQPVNREYAVSEFDFSLTPVRESLGLTIDQCRWYVIIDQRWKYVAFTGDFRPVLFDLDNDPDELDDLGDSQQVEHREVINRMESRLREWFERNSQRTTLSDEQIRDKTGKSVRQGVVLGIYEASDEQEPLFAHYRGKVKKDYTNDLP